MPKLGPFELLDPLARGGMGEVWLARHTTSGADVAIKVITADYARHPGFVESLRHEVRAMARLSHPHIVRVLDQGEIDGVAAEGTHHQLVKGSPYIAMEAVRGGTLADHVLRLPWEDVHHILQKLLGALAHAHARDVLHRDLKPANILLAEGGTTWEIKLTDFGIAQPLHSDRAVGPAVAGTPLYMAPEQSTGDWRSYRPATDLFAVGRIATALLARENGIALVPVGFDAWLERILAELPQDRFPMAADALHALRQLGPATEPLASSFAPDAHPTTVRHQAPTAGIVSLADVRSPSELGRFTPPIPASWRRTNQAGPDAPLTNAGAGLLRIRVPDLVGRIPERDRLWSLLQRVHQQRRTHIAILRGPEGIGKRSLARWLQDRAYEVGAAWPHHAAFDPLESGLTTLSQLLAREMKTQGLPHLEAAPRVQRLAQLYGVTDPYDLDALAEAANPKVDDEPGFRFQDRDEHLRLLARFLHWAATERPVLVHLEDVQWSLSALELLGAVLELDRERPVPLLFVLTVQEPAIDTCPLERAALERLEATQSARVTRLQLGPLAAADHRALLASMLGLAPTLVAKLAEQTADSPLHAVQRVIHLHETNRLLPSPTGWVLAEGSAAGSSVDAIWRHRLTSFLVQRSENSRISVELLAVLGRSVPADTWLRLCRRAGVAPSNHLVDSMLSLGLLQRSDDDTFSFPHPTLRDAVLALASDAGRRRTHHGHCADLLLRRGRGADRHGRIGEHLLQAGRTSAALEHLRKGAEATFEEGQVHRGTELVARWRDALMALDPPDDDPRWGDGLLLEAHLALSAADPHAATSIAMRLSRRASTHGWAMHEVAAHTVMGRAAALTGDHYDTIRTLETALAHADAEHFPALRAEIVYTLARAWRQWGDREKTTRLTAEARRLYLQLEDTRGELRCLLLAASNALQSQRPDEALTLAGTARTLAAEVGTLKGQAEALIMAGEVHRTEGRLEQALVAYRLAVRMLRATAGPNRSIVGELNVGQTLTALGRHQEALDTLSSAIERLHHLGLTSTEAIAHCLVLPSLAVTGQRSAYKRHLFAAKRLYDEASFRETDATEAITKAADAAESHGWRKLAGATRSLARLLASGG